MNKELCPICLALLKEPNELHECVDDVTGFCGCGNHRDALRFLRDTLKYVKNNDFDNYEVNYDGVHSGLSIFLLYYINDKGFTDHGFNIKNCWLSEKGKKTLKLLQENLKDE